MLYKMFIIISSNLHVQLFKKVYLLFLQVYLKLKIKFLIYKYEYTGLHSKIGPYKMRWLNNSKILIIYEFIGFMRASTLQSICSLTQ